MQEVFIFAKKQVQWIYFANHGPSVTAHYNETLFLYIMLVIFHLPKYQFECFQDQGCSYIGIVK